MSGRIFSSLLVVLWVTAVQAQIPNKLSNSEVAEGWKLLFNGSSLKGWHVYGGGVPGKDWQVETGALKLSVPVRAGNKAPNGGDLVTDQIIKGDFEFKAEWKVEKYTNSGIFFFVKEEKRYPKVYTTGLELQVLDDQIYDGAKENTHRAGDFFSVANARLREINPVGEWNSIHFILKNDKLTVYQNGFMIQEHRLSSPEWKQKMANSKINQAPIAKGDFTGRIGLQDWGSTVWFRNIKWKPIVSK
ncbi:uncharacterized protein DUF1080 [Dyadobacter jejuensis]|uniref:Uncharacterized protein DUF1080 n=1 Tax=Dyadobacter jejuensis TaxID=1082580 RepID=A0A316ANE5_9BACT|nr:DUF1080 domain-containing protein [Dyadobacter jejuensis]PWJ59275.1 uncharacterized protein DUF1080 [Dyadobacter jejuensis]